MTDTHEKWAAELMGVAFPLAQEYVKADSPEVWEEVEKNQALICLFSDDDLPFADRHIATQAERGHRLLFKGAMGVQPFGIIIVAVFAYPPGTPLELDGRLLEEVAAMCAKRNEAYRDDSCSERNCDYCDEPYRGNAVYCSFDCARADAWTIAAGPRQ